jgi:hypothetical protein
MEDGSLKCGIDRGAGHRPSESAENEQFEDVAQPLQGRLKVTCPTQERCANERFGSVGKREPEGRSKRVMTRQPERKVGC